MEKKNGCTKVCTVSFMSSGPCPATIAIVPERVFLGSEKPPLVGQSVGHVFHISFANDKSSAKIQKAPAQEQKFQTLSRKCIKEPEKPPQLVISIPTFIIKFGELIPWFRHHTLHVSSVAFGMIGFLLLDWNLNNQPLETMFSWCVHHAPFKGLNLQEHSYIGIRLDEVIWIHISFMYRV